eukprot:12331064-Karenia_brevis.AAC.1
MDATLGWALGLPWSSHSQVQFRVIPSPDFLMDVTLVWALGPQVVTLGCALGPTVPWAQSCPSAI